MFRARQHAVAALATLLAGACQGPPVQHAAVREASVPSIALGSSLAPLEAAFDARVEVPRLVALLPVRCADCACGLDAVRRSILRAFPDEGLHVFVVLPPGDLCDGCGADMIGALVDQRVTYFRDREGHAARTFARGLLPIARASEMFLFYPRGTRWHTESTALAAGQASTVSTAPTFPGAPPAVTVPSAPPRADAWWHRMGRIAPGRHCAEQELDAALSGTMARLLAEAAEDRARSGVELARQ
jgi:hypothetical protein